VLWEEGGLVKKLRVVRVDSPDGETHYLLQESRILEPSENSKDFDQDEIKKIAKRDAAKPLLIVRK
jgi:hypothetical protein